jgi:hypothetical protein
MSLVELDNNATDKNTIHSYLPIYDELLKDYKCSMRNVMEIGVYAGGSIKLWKDYFINAKVVGIDLNNIDKLKSASVVFQDEILNNDRVDLYLSTNAYNMDIINHLSSNYSKFDMILDDGSHSLEDMKFFITHYSQLLNDNGILIVEDIQEESWIEILKECVPDDLKSYIHIYDIRHIKNRYDDILLVINKNRKRND